MRYHILRVTVLILYLLGYIWAAYKIVVFFYDKFLQAVIENAGYDYEYVYLCDQDAQTYKQILYKLSDNILDAVTALTVVSLLFVVIAYEFILRRYAPDIKAIYRSIYDFIMDVLQQSRR